MGTAAVLVLTGTAVLWINGRWPTGGFRVPEWAFTGTGENGRDAGKGSADQNDVAQGNGNAEMGGREFNRPLESETGKDAGTDGGEMPRIRCRRCFLWPMTAVQQAGRLR